MEIITERPKGMPYRKYVEMRYRWISHILPPQWLININIPQGRCVLSAYFLSKEREVA